MGITLLDGGGLLFGAYPLILIWHLLQGIPLSVGRETVTVSEFVVRANFGDFH